MILDDIAMFELLPFDNILSFLVFHFISVRLLRSTHFKSIPMDSSTTVNQDKL